MSALPATSSSSSSCNAAGSSESAKCASDLFLEAKEFLKTSDFEKAVSTASTVLELATAEKNPDKVVLARYYMFYGDALLRLSQTQNDLVSEKMRQQQAQSALTAVPEEEREVKAEDEEVTASTTTEEAATASAEPKDKPVSESEKAQKESKDEKAGAEREGEKEDKKEDFFLDEGAFDAMMAANSSDDRELSWEALETARVLAKEAMEKEKTKENESLLADIHALLAELQLENSNFPQSIEEYEKAIAIQHDMGGENVREIAFLHFMAVMAAENGQMEEAYSKHLDCAFEVICARLIALLVKHGMEVTEDAECDVILEAMTELFGDKKKRTSIEEKERKEMEDLRQSLEDLMERAENPPQGESEELMDKVRLIMSQFGGLVPSQDPKAQAEPTQAAGAAAGAATNDDTSKENEEPPTKADQPIRQLGDFGKGRKRSLEEAGISDDVDANPKSKRVRENGAVQSENSKA